MRHYDLLLREQRGSFTVIVDKTYEDLSVRDCFDDTVHNIDEICRKIDNYTYDWFMLRTRVEFEGVELACEYLGGCLYEDAREVLTDGMAEDQIYQALINARRAAEEMKEKFAKLDPKEVDLLVN